MSDSIKNPKPIAPTSAKDVSTSKATNASGAPSKNTKLAPKKNTQAGDPAIKDSAARTHVKATSGAAYGVRAKMNAYTAPEAGAIQSNGRIIPSAVKRSRPNFTAGMAE